MHFAFLNASGALSGPTVTLCAGDVEVQLLWVPQTDRCVS